MIVPSAYMAWAKRIGMMPTQHELTASGMPSMAWADLGAGELPLWNRHFYGAPGLRAIIGELHGVPGEQVLIGGGTSTVNFLVAAALLERGDRVVVETPTYEPLVRMFEFLGASVVPWRRRWEDRFQPDLEALAPLVQGAKMVAVTNLHNPTGVMVERARLETIAAVARAAGATLLVDEVYLDFVEPVVHAPAGEGVVTTASLTKVYGLTGLRMGWAVGPRGLIEKAWQVKDLTSVIDPYPMEELAERVLRGRDRFREPVRAHAAANKEIVMAWAKAEGLELAEPAGGIIAAVKLPEGMDAGALNEHLVSTHATRVVPGDFFGLPGFVRVGFGGDADNLREGLRRLAAGILGTRGAGR